MVGNLYLVGGLPGEDTDDRPVNACKIAFMVSMLVPGSKETRGRLTTRVVPAESVAIFSGSATEGPYGKGGHDNVAGLGGRKPSALARKMSAPSAGCIDGNVPAIVQVIGLDVSVRPIVEEHTHRYPSGVGLLLKGDTGRRVGSTVRPH